MTCSQGMCVGKQIGASMIVGLLLGMQACGTRERYGCAHERGVAGPGVGWGEMHPAS